MKGTLRRIVILLAFGVGYFTYVISSNHFNWSQEIRNGLTVLLICAVIWGSVTVLAQAVAAHDARRRSENRIDDDHGF